MNDTARIIALTDEWRRYYALLDAGFTDEQAEALAIAGYDITGYVDPSTFRAFWLTGEGQ